MKFNLTRKLSTDEKTAPINRAVFFFLGIHFCPRTIFESGTIRFIASAGTSPGPSIIIDKSYNGRSAFGA
jgi:hypothetical protein